MKILLVPPNVTSRLLREVHLLPPTCGYIELQSRRVARQFSNSSERFTSSSESSLSSTQSFLPVHTESQRDRLFHRARITQLHKIKFQPAQRSLLNQKLLEHRCIIVTEILL